VLAGIAYCTDNTTDTMRNLEKGAAAAAKEEEDYPLICKEEECNIKKGENSSSTGTTTPSSSSSSLFPRVSTSSHKKCSKCTMLFLLITIIALSTALVSVSQIRITISITNGGTATADAAANDSHANATIDEVTDKDSQTAESAIDDVVARQDHPITVSAPLNMNNSRMHVDYHTNHFDYSSSWCPNAKCQGTPLCYPCQRRWLIVVTVGRSASTSLTRMLNLLPGVRMTGENNDLVGRFANLLQGSSPDMLDGTGAAWFHNPIPKESWSCAAQSFFAFANPPKLQSNGELLESDERTILGFKTIRLFNSVLQKNGNTLSQLQVQEIAKNKVEALNRLFPCARFVVNFQSDKKREVAAWKRQFGATNTTKSSQLLETEDHLLHMFHHIMGLERSYLLDSTEWTRNITVFNEMVDWLGFSPQCHFQAALEYNTKDGYYATKTEADCSLSQECIYLY
jgi:hypothetical protein